MTADPTRHVVTIAEHTVYAAVCTSCPWVSGGHLDPDWAVVAADGHEVGHRVGMSGEGAE